MGRLQHPNPPKRMGAPRTANIRDSAGDADPGRASLTAVRNEVYELLLASCATVSSSSMVGLAFVVCLFVAGFVLLLDHRLVAQAIEIARRCAAIALGPDVVMGNGVCCPGRKGVGSEQFHE